MMGHVFVLLLLPIVAVSERIDISMRDYVVLIADVHHYYKTSCVIFVQSDSYNGECTGLEIDTLSIVTGNITLGRIPVFNDARTKYRAIQKRCLRRKKNISIQLSAQDVGLMTTFRPDDRSSSVHFSGLFFSDLDASAVMHSWSMEFSRRGFFSVTITLSELEAEMRKYQSQIVRPLYVVLLYTEKTKEEFAEATRHLDTSFPVWFVIFMPYPGNPLESFCENPTENDFNLIFSTEMLILCYDHSFLKEWYALGDNRTRVFKLATWSQKTGLNFTTTESLYARRTNMYGEIVRVATVKESPFITAKNGVLSEFLGLVLIELSRVMNFRMEILDSVEAYGSWLEEEQAWSGVIGQLVDNKADLGAAEFTVTNHRLTVVDFTLPLLLSRNRLYIKEPVGFAVQWSGYFKAFNKETWAMILVIIMVAPVLLTVIKLRGHVSIDVLTENYIHVWGIFCQQGLSEFPNESSLRFAFLSLFISAIIISAAYSASLISFLAVTTPVLPFSTIEGFVKDGSYKLIVFRNSADYDMFDNAKDNMLQKMMELMKDKQDLPMTLIEGFQQVCTEKVGFYTTEAIKSAINLYLPCKVVFIETGRTDSLAMTLTKENPYTGLMNYHLQRFQDNGVLNRLKAKFVLTTNPPTNTYNAVDLWDIAPILALLSSGAFLGCLILIIEKIYSINKGEYNENAASREANKSTRTKFINRIFAKNKNKVSKSRYTFKFNNTKEMLGYWP
ncbi:hypothetical protein KM043_000712 [Ampulex compressa]|nr:hypothetical protein KM043_000712 [Ampulex compressa]